MRRALRLAAALVPMLVLAGAITGPVSAVPASAPGVQIAFDRATVVLGVGDRFALPSVLTNTGTAPSEPMLAHLNVASLTDDVYVDPEDWSASRSKQVPSIPPAGSIFLDWQLQAVNAGSFDVYVALLPNGQASAGAGPLVVSPPVHLTVAARKSLSAGGALPVALAVPILLGLLAAAARTRHRRSD
jgi:hypothetical protein